MKGKLAILGALFIGILLILAIAQDAYALNGTIIKIIDGDTIDVRLEIDDSIVRVRLFGIDCPEMNQPYGKEAKLYLDTFLDEDVILIMMDVDRYERVIAIVTTYYGLTINESLLLSGLAWVYPQYCQNCGQWKAFQKRAQELEKGLWADNNQVAPWDWRKGKR